MLTVLVKWGFLLAGGMDVEWAFYGDLMVIFLIYSFYIDGMSHGGSFLFCIQKKKKKKISE